MILLILWLAGGPVQFGPFATPLACHTAAQFIEPEAEYLCIDAKRGVPRMQPPVEPK